MAIHPTAQIQDSTVETEHVREFVTVHDSTVAVDARLYERVSVKKATIGPHVDINAGSYVENAAIESNVQIGPNASVVGVTHRLSEASGMEHRNDQFEEIVLETGAFVGAGAVVLPGVTVGANAVIGANVTVTDDVPEGVVIRG